MAKQLHDVSPNSIRRTQAVIDFFLAAGVSQGDKLKAFAEIAPELFPEITPVRAEEGFYSLEYLRMHCEYPYSCKDAPLPLGDVLVLITEETVYRQKKGMVSQILEAVIDYESADVAVLLQKISAATNITQRAKSELNAKSYYSERSNTSKGFISGVRNLDKLIDGFEYGTLTTVAGYAGQFKTTFLLSLLYNSLYLGYNSVFISLEIPKELLYFRLLSRHSYAPKFITVHKPVSFIDIYKSRLTKEQQDFLFGHVEPDFKLFPGKLVMLEQNELPDFTYTVMDSYVRSLPFKIDAVFMDYVQLLAQSRVQGSRDVKEVGNFYVSEFRRLAIASPDYRRIVFIAAQVNRDGYLRAEKNGGRLDLRSLSDLNQLEKDSSYVIGSFTDDALRASGEIKVSLMKNRFGEITDVPVTSHVDPRFAVIGDEIEGFSDPISSSEVQDICSTLLE